MVSPKCSIVENDGELMLMALHFTSLSATAAIFSGVRTVFGFERFDLSMKIIMMRNPYAIFVNILQHYHDFQSNVAIFPCVVQAYTQPFSFIGRIELIIR